MIGNIIRQTAQVCLRQRISSEPRSAGKERSRNMYRVDSMKAEEFISHEEILETLEYADRNKDNLS